MNFLEELNLLVNKRIEYYKSLSLQNDESSVDNICKIDGKVITLIETDQPIDEWAKEHNFIELKIKNIEV